jgi:proteasomal ATPase-associated factor 1
MALISIQKDWDEAIKQENEKFWVSLKRKDQPTLHGFLYNPKAVIVSSQSNPFVIKSWNKNHLSVHCTITDTSTSFLAPLATLSLTTDKILSLDVSSSGELGVCSSVDGSMWVWDCDTGETRRVLEGHVSDVGTCRFFPSGVVVLSGGNDFRLKIWSAIDGKCVRTLVGHTRAITDTCIVEKGRNVISTSDDGNLCLWDCGTGQRISVITSENCPVNKCDIMSSPGLCTTSNGHTMSDNEHCTDGKVVMIVTDNGHVKLFDIRNKSMISDYHCSSHPILCGIFAGDDRVIVGADDGTLDVFDIRQLNNGPLLSTVVNPSPITSMTIHDQYTLIGYRDGACVMCDHHMTGITCLTGPDVDPVTSIVSCSRNNRIYTSSRDGSVRLYKFI